MRLHSVKRAVARICDLTGIDALGAAVLRARAFPYIRAVNYHSVPPALAAAFTAQLEWYATCFVNVTHQDLADFLAGHPWPHDRPGLILSFDDGDRSHIDVVAPLLERHGFTGWFFVPIGLLQGADAVGAAPSPPDAERLTVEQLRALDATHVVGCHTETHRRLTAAVSPTELSRETVGAKAILERVLERRVDTFCWVGGEEPTYNAEAAALIRDAYAFSFMTNSAPIVRATSPWQLQRTNVEADNPLWLVRFQLSGLMDLAYAAKRRRVNRLTSSFLR